LPQTPQDKRAADLFDSVSPLKEMADESVELRRRQGLARWCQRMWNTLWVELREVIWLASVVGGLTLVAVGIVVALAIA